MRNMQKENTFDINQLSDHLFWDVDRSKLDLNTHFRFVLQRILSYGLMRDWNLFYNEFGIKRITEEAKEIRNMDERSLHFIAHLSGLDIHDFKCYTTKQSIPQHWNF